MIRKIVFNFAKIIQKALFRVDKCCIREDEKAKILNQKCLIDF